MQRQSDSDREFELAERVRVNQQRLRSALQRRYDFIVCGAGTSGSVIARRLAENPDAHVLLLEAGGSDDVPRVWTADLWPTNLGSERDWGFPSERYPRRWTQSPGPRFPPHFRRVARPKPDMHPLRVDVAIEKTGDSETKRAPTGLGHAARG